MKNIVRAIAAVVVALSVSACGGGGSNAGSILPANSGGNSSPAAASIVITIPRASSASKAKPQYVSASTQSISAAIAPAAGCSGCSSANTVNANLTPSSPGCVAAAGGTTCTIALALNPGPYTATVATYDAANQGGNKLSSNQAVPFTVTANAANQIPMVLDGIPSSLTLALSGTPPATLASGTLTIDGAATAVTISATTKDADNNTIVGAGAPTVASAVVTGNALYAAGTPSGSTFTLTTPAAGSRTPATVTVTMAAPNCPGAAACTGTLTASMTEFIALTETTANTVTVYSERTQTWSTPVTSMDGYSTIFDPSGNLWTANANANSVTEFAPPYTGAPKTTITNGIDIPQSLAMDSNGNLFVTNVGGLPAYLQEYAPPYTSAPVLSIDDASVASMRNILIDNKNDLWITNDSATTALYELPAPVSTSHETNLGALGCQGITQDNAGNIVAACATTDHLYAYTTAGVAVNNAGIGESFPFLIPYPGGGTLDVIGSHSAGSVPIAFNDQTTSTFLHINCNCAVPSGIVIDANKLMYIADISNNVVVTLPYPYTGTAQLLQSGFGGAWAMAIWP